MGTEEFSIDIKQSHERCKKFKISEEQVYSSKIISDNELQNKFSEKRKMILTAAPYMEELIRFVQGCNFFALLTDGEGCILNAIGDEKILSEAFELKMIPGAYMDEESIGTNAMAIVIITGNPVQLSGKEHFIKAYHRWTCSAAPIRDEHGNLLGVLNLTGYTEDVHPHTLGMIIAASKAIEEMIKVNEFYKYKDLNQERIRTIFNSMPVAIMTSDLQGRVRLYNNKMTELLEQEGTPLKIKNMSEIVKDWSCIQEVIANRDKVEKDIQIMTPYSEVNCQLTANPVYNPTEDGSEIVYIFEEIKRIKRQAYYTFEQIIGQDENFLKLVHYAKRIADSKSTILILGESGTGKEVFAQAIHNYSVRREGPFIAINCGAIPKQLMELELFGYEEGAYVGAKKGGSPGKFEQADGGTILLDEIGELPLDMQIKLQRVLQEGIITRIGSEKSIPVNVRVIAATNKDLKEEVKIGGFRKDLFYRLNVLPLYLPPLRERKGDIKLLIRYYMKSICDNLGKQEVEIPKEYFKLMKNYGWPGNIRELENVVELIANTETIPPEYFSEKMEEDKNCQNENLNLDFIEKEHLIKVLNKNNGNITKTSNDLGIGRNTLYSKLKKHNLQI